ncbi:hypothetical protein THAR02_10488 [Trichoderma harzianum]|uniref:Uncharacterized protein n=1 Tax=Trichoderma harzianum TaxID=5544 RepID=A0A0F9X9G3_TRIHA|nr:hypothetical protein THAR02_10488 [Trichoderma harzianum]
MEGLQQPLSRYSVHHGTVSTRRDAGRFFPRTFPQAHSSLPQSPPESLAACPATSMRFWETIATHCVSATGQAPLLLVKPLPYKRRMSRWAGWGINSSVAPKRQKKHFRLQNKPHESYETDLEGLGLAARPGELRLLVSRHLPCCRRLSSEGPRDIFDLILGSLAIESPEFPVHSRAQADVSYNHAHSALVHVNTYVMFILAAADAAASAC